MKCRIRYTAHVGYGIDSHGMSKSLTNTGVYEFIEDTDQIAAAKAKDWLRRGSARLESFVRIDQEEKTTSLGHMLHNRFSPKA